MFSHNGPGAQTCLGVLGSGAMVEGTRVSHGDGVNWTPMCGFQSKSWGTLSSGAAFSRTFGYTSACTPVPFYNTTTINQNFRKGTNVSGQAYHNGGWAPGIPTVAIQ